MVIISVTITESEEQIVNGIPKQISLSTNIPSSIFYTLDGTDPNLMSLIYINPFFLPFDKLSINLKVMATNGTDFSPIISEIYTSNILNNARLSHSATDVSPSERSLDNLYPFGDPPLQPNGIYLNPGDAGITVNNPDLTQIPSAYDGDGYGAAFTNQSYTIENYNIKYSTTDAQGKQGFGIGTLPATVEIEQEPAPAEESNQFTSTFDPRALVIFQDFSKENPEDPPQINRQYFSLENINKSRDGDILFNSGLDSPTTTGSFLRSHFNPKDQTMSYYYFDSSNNRWIISKVPFKPNENFVGNLSTAYFSRNAGVGQIFEWIPFQRRVLF